MMHLCAKGSHSHSSLELYNRVNFQRQIMIFSQNNCPQKISKKLNQDIICSNKSLLIIVLKYI